MANASCKLHNGSLRFIHAVKASTAADNVPDDNNWISHERGTNTNNPR
jgi:hypothetical protein